MTIGAGHGLLLKLLAMFFPFVFEWRAWRRYRAVHLIYNRAQGYLVKGECDSAIRLYAMAVSINSENVKAYHALAHAYEANGEYGRAIAEYTKALAVDHTLGRFATLDPHYDLATTFLLRGETYRTQGTFDLAIADFDTAMLLGMRDVSREARSSRESCYRDLYGSEDVECATSDCHSMNAPLLTANRTGQDAQVVMFPVAIVRALLTVPLTFSLEAWGAVRWQMVKRHYVRAQRYHDQADYESAIAEYAAALEGDLEHNLFSNPSRERATSPMLQGFSSAREHASDFLKLHWCYVRRGLSFLGNAECVRANQDFDSACTIWSANMMIWTVQECKRIARQIRRDARRNLARSGSIPRLEDLTRKVVREHRGY